MTKALKYTEPQNTFSFLCLSPGLQNAGGEDHNPHQPLQETSTDQSRSRSNPLQIPAAFFTTCFNAA